MKTLFRCSSLKMIFNIKSVFFLLICFLGLSVIIQGYSQAEENSSGKSIPEEDDEAPAQTSDLTGAGASAPEGDPFSLDGNKQENANKLITFVKEISGEDVGAGSDAAFGGAITTISDLDGNGIDELVVGAFNSDDRTGGNPGAVFMIFFDRNGNILHFHKITSNQGGFVGEIPDGASFGHSVVNGGDINGDGVDDLLVDAPDHIHEKKKDKGSWKIFYLILRPGRNCRSSNKNRRQGGWLASWF